MSALLPIGSVVRVKGSPTTLLIIGHGPISKETNTVYDYVATNYPFGLGSNTQAMMFDCASIEQVLFEGYTDDNAKIFYRAIGKLIGKD